MFLYKTFSIRTVCKNIVYKFYIHGEAILLKGG